MSFTGIGKTSKEEVGLQKTKQRKPQQKGGVA